MDKMVIEGGHPLSGEVQVNGAKNSALPLIFSTLLAPGCHVLNNVPQLQDIHSACSLLKSMGCETELQGACLKVQIKTPLKTLAHYDQVRKMRASVLVLGPLLARLGQVKVSLPGGCAIGSRPVDIHLDAFRKMGAQIKVQGGYVVAEASQLKGSSIEFPFPTVGGTENVMMAACLAQGPTEIHNAAREPEIEDLACYLNAMGGRVEGAGTSHIRIQGQKFLKPSTYSVTGDRIEAGTLLVAGAITGGQVRVGGVSGKHLSVVLKALEDMGCQIHWNENSISLKVNQPLKSVDIETAPYPGFPTDLQAQIMALLTQAQGFSWVSENVFENRFMHVAELNRLGAEIRVEGSKAKVFGQPGKLIGASVMATDLRASACLILAGLVAQGQTQVHRLYHLDRGYEKLEQKIAHLGGCIERVSS